MQAAGVAGLQLSPRAPMIKILTFTQARAGTSPQAFEQYWLQSHVPMWRDVPGIKGYIVSTVVAEHTRSDVAGFEMGPVNGIVELWFKDEAAMARSAASPGGQAWRADSARFIGAMRSFLTIELPVVQLPADTRPPVKALSIVQRPLSQGAAAFQHYWSDVHAPMAASVPDLRGFVLSRIQRELVRTDIPPIAMASPDGFTSSFVDSIEARNRMTQSAAAKAWFADGAIFLGAVRTFILAEHVVLQPTN